MCERIKSLITGVIFTLAANPVAAAPPALFYSLLALNHKQSVCLNRAYAAAVTEVIGRVDRRQDNISLVNDDFNIGVHCRRTGQNKSFVTIVVAHRSKFDEARGVALNIRRSIESGVFE